MLYDLTELRSLFGDDLDSLKELLDNFIVDAGASLAKINEACLTLDVSVIKTELHKFMGMVTSLHIVSIKHVLKNIEGEINERGLDDTNLSNITLITSILDTVITQLKNEIKF
jgi:HPt (histidine-containing phosphotransfer) domain-containing protein